LQQKNILFTCILFSSFLSSSFFAQKINLKLKAIHKIESAVLEKINFQQKHSDTISSKLEVYKISNYLKNIGYFTNTIDSVKKTSKEHVVYFSLNDKIEKAILQVSSDSIQTNNSFITDNKVIPVPIEKLEAVLLEISENLDKDGRSFSKVQLENIILKDKTLFADIKIQPSEKRSINNIIIKGYEDFPKSFLKNYFNIKSNSTFNQQKINEISDASKGLPFIKEIKLPEVLFTKDSTLLYMYLKKEQNNSFDALVNFASKEDGKLLFNGTVDLKLINVLNSGEEFELFWNSIGNERQEFKISTEIPYVFNSPITPEVSFSIYKQDSTFLNTSFNSKIKYTVTDKLKLGLSYDSESSGNLQQSNLSKNINQFSNNFFGFHILYKKPKYDQFLNNQFYLEVNPSFGKRATEETSTNQFKIRTISSYIYTFNYRNNIYIKNDTGYLNSDTYFNNELFRIGGANSIRGFNEQSIFTSSYTYFNIEYRFLTSENSYVYSVTDIGRVKEINTNLTSFGLGYLFKTNGAQININTVLEKNPSKPFDFADLKLIVSWRNIF
jgi:outer membrane protein assembly factor BamA